MLVHSKENNPVSEAILKKNKKKISGQVYNIAKALCYGANITVKEGIEIYGTMYLPRRIKDIEQKLGLRVNRYYDGNGIVHYYLDVIAQPELKKRLGI